MSFEIEPALKRHIDARLAIAQATFASEVDAEQSLTSMLMVYAGFGLVRLDADDPGRPVWRGTELFETSTPHSFDVKKLAEMVADAGVSSIRLSASLKIVIGKFVEFVGSQRMARVDVDADGVLFNWVGAGLVALDPDDDEFRWTFSKEFLRPDAWQRFSEFPRFQNWLREQMRRPKLCRHLRQQVSLWLRLAEGQLGRRLPKDMVGGLFLPSMFENNGDAVAYLTASGRLAWRASPQFLQDLDAA